MRKSCVCWLLLPSSAFPLTAPGAPGSLQGPLLRAFMSPVCMHIQLLQHLCQTTPLSPGTRQHQQLINCFKHNVLLTMWDPLTQPLIWNLWMYLQVHVLLLCSSLHRLLVAYRHSPSLPAGSHALQLQFHNVLISENCTPCLSFSHFPKTGKTWG